MKRWQLHPADPAPGDGVFGLPHRADEALVHLVPVPFEATVSYGAGTARGPAAMREASAQVDLLDGDAGRPHRMGVYQHRESAAVRKWGREARKAAQPVIDVVGEIGSSRRLRRLRDLVNDRCERLNEWLESQVGDLLDDGGIVGVLGGDHSVPYGAIAAHAARTPSFGILHFDAHFDLRDAYEGFTWSHASIMRNVLTRLPAVSRLVQVGIRDYCDEEMAFVRRSNGRIRAFLDQDIRDAALRGRPFAATAQAVADALPRDVYVSFDIDGLDPKLCPDTGTPVPGGLSFQEACAVLNEVVASGRRIIGFDLVEVAGSAWNANVGARLLYKLIGATLRTRVVALSPK